MTLRNWLSQESQARVDVVVLNSKADHSEFLCCSLEVEYFIPWETLVFALNGFNLLYKAHSYYEEYSALLKVN